MSKKLLFGAITSVFTLNVFADPVTITTQDYVDTAVATKQDKISGRAAESTYGIPLPASVITDTDTDGVVAKRVIIYGDDYDGWYTSPQTIGNAIFAGNLLTQAQVKGMKDIYGYSDDDMKNAIVSADMLMAAFARTRELLNYKQKTKVCVQYIDGAAQTSENCLLWNLPD